MNVSNACKPSPQSGPGADQRGQSLVEFLVLAVALVPLFLLMPMLAKYQDIGHATQLASRYVAFDATVRNDGMSSWKPEGELAGELRRRFFTDADASIRTNEFADNSAAQQHRSWRGPTGDPLVANVTTDVVPSFGPDRAARHTNAFTPASDATLFQPFAGFLGLNSRGIYTGHVSVRLANVPEGLRFYEPLDRLDLVMVRSTSLIVDPWSARYAAQVDARVGGHPALFPSGALAAVRPMVDAAVRVIDVPGALEGPQLGALDFWSDVVPNDRLTEEARP